MSLDLRVVRSCFDITGGLGLDRTSAPSRAPSPWEGAPLPWSSGFFLGESIFPHKVSLSSTLSSLDALDDPSPSSSDELSDDEVLYSELESSSWSGKPSAESSRSEKICQCNARQRDRFVV